MENSNDLKMDKKNDALFLRQFDHFISIGHCCYVADELSDLGLRDSSYPFDWVRTRWKAIDRSFKTHFDGYLEYDLLYQKEKDLHVYKNLDYGVSFFHDFTKSKPLKAQMKQVQEKYQKRIDRFFSAIQAPTLFIRYCWDLDELQYISEHYSEIESMLKQYNPQNEVVFISHDLPGGLDVSGIKFLFFIDKNEKGSTNEKPISSNEELYTYLKTVDYPHRESNIRFLKEKNDRVLQNRRKITQRIKRQFEKIQDKKEYIHDKKCD